MSVPGHRHGARRSRSSTRRLKALVMGKTVARRRRSSRRTARSSIRPGPTGSRPSRRIDSRVDAHRRRARSHGRDAVRPGIAEPARDALLGVDLGERRIGVAIADADGSPARPLDDPPPRAATLAADAAPRARATRTAVDELVVGLPLEARAGRVAGGADPALGPTRSPRDSGFAANLSRRASDQPPRRGAPGSDETGPIRRAADAKPSATPIAPGSTAKPPRSSCRTSSTHARDAARPCPEPPTTHGDHT